MAEGEPPVMAGESPLVTEKRACFKQEETGGNRRGNRKTVLIS
jgi:hypothetical protein